MRTLFPAFLLVLATSLAAAQSPAPPPRPCTGPEYRQFDFWVGDWTVTVTDGRAAGTSHVERFADGCGVQEEWTSAGGSTGRSLNGYRAADGRWHQVWLGADGIWLDLSGGLQDGAMVLEGRTTMGNGSVVRQRITWTPRDDGRVRQFWQQSADEGRTWEAAFDGLYTPR